MANIITVLVEHDNINYYKDRLNDVDREVVLKALGEDIADMYMQYDSNATNVEPNMSDVSSTSDSYILGFERPNDIIEVAKEWNSELRDNAVRHLEELEALAQESGFSTVSQYVKENWNSDDFASINYWLKYTLMDLDNAYNYNTTGLVYDKSNGWEVVISDSTLAKIKEHPENFVYLTLSYMSCLFSKCLRLKVIDLESWDFSQVSDANEMFAYCEKLEKIIANFNFKMIKEMAFMFCYCTKLSKVDLSHSDLSHVFDFGYTFFKCEGLKDIRFSQGVWQKAKLTLSMFDNCKALERLNLPDVILNDVIRSYAMFDDCDSLKEIYMEHPLNLDKYERELIFGNCKAEVKKSTEWQ